jgi:hypothetical protein
MKLIIVSSDSKCHFLDGLDVVFIILELFSGDQDELLDFFVAIAEACALFVGEKVFLVVGAHVRAFEEEMVFEFFFCQIIEQLCTTFHL